MAHSRYRVAGQSARIVVHGPTRAARSELRSMHSAGRLAAHHAALHHACVTRVQSERVQPLALLCLNRLRLFVNHEAFRLVLAEILRHALGDTLSLACGLEPESP